MQELEKVSTLTALDVYSPGKAINLIELIETEVRSYVPDLNTSKGRKNIASLSAKVSSTKALLDNLGKELTSEWKAKSKLVDNDRKLVRERLDKLRDEARKPLTDYEEKEKAKIEAEMIEKEIEEDFEEGLKMNAQFDIDKRNALELEQLRKEKAEREELEQKRITKEREEKLQKEREEALLKEQEEKHKQELAEIEADKQEAIQREKQQAARDAELAEKRRLLDIEKAKQEAINAAKIVEKQRLDELEAERKREEAKQKNKRHIAKIHNEILKDLSSIMDEKTAKTLVEKIARKQISHIKIEY